MGLLIDEPQQQRRAVSFQGLDWLEEIERSRRGQEKRHQQKQARLAAKYYKSKRKALENATTTTTAVESDITLHFQDFLEFLSSNCNKNEKDNDDHIRRQQILDLPLCSATLSTFAFSQRNNMGSSTASGSSTVTTLKACSTQQDKINLICKLQSNMKDKTAPPLDIVVYYGGLVWMSQAKSNGLCDDCNDGANKKQSTILPNSSAIGKAVKGNTDNADTVNPYQYHDIICSSVPHTTIIDETTTRSEKNASSKREQQLMDNENQIDTGVDDPSMTVKKPHQSSHHHESDNWLVCFAQSY